MYRWFFVRYYNIMLICFRVVWIMNQGACFLLFLLYIVFTLPLPHQYFITLLRTFLCLALLPEGALFSLYSYQFEYVCASLFHTHDTLCFLLCTLQQLFLVRCFILINKVESNVIKICCKMLHGASQFRTWRCIFSTIGFFEGKCIIYFWQCYTDENESCRDLVYEGTSLVII